MLSTSALPNSSNPRLTRHVACSPRHVVPVVAAFVGVLDFSPLHRARLRRDDDRLTQGHPTAKDTQKGNRIPAHKHAAAKRVTLEPGCKRPAWKRAEVTRRGPRPQMSICLSCSSKFNESPSTDSLGPCQQRDKGGGGVG
jgi:hypothetical protein